MAVIVFVVSDYSCGGLLRKVDSYLCYIRGKHKNLMQSACLDPQNSSVMDRHMGFKIKKPNCFFAKTFFIKKNSNKIKGEFFKGLEQNWNIRRLSSCSDAM